VLEHHPDFDPELAESTAAWETHLARREFVADHLAVNLDSPASGNLQEVDASEEGALP
jgi:hypothetical protein